MGDGWEWPRGRAACCACGRPTGAGPAVVVGAEQRLHLVAQGSLDVVVSEDLVHGFQKFAAVFLPEPQVAKRLPLLLKEVVGYARALERGHFLPQPFRAAVPPCLMIMTPLAVRCRHEDQPATGNRQHRADGAIDRIIDERRFVLDDQARRRETAYRLGGPGQAHHAGVVGKGETKAIVLLEDGPGL